MIRYYKMQQILLQNATVVLLQNKAKYYYKFPVYYDNIVILIGPSTFDEHKSNQFEGQ